MVIFQKIEGKTTSLNFWIQKIEGKNTTLQFWFKDWKEKPLPWNFLSAFLTSTILNIAQEWYLHYFWNAEVILHNDILENLIPEQNSKSY
jgi:hypothetical protein